jgi:lipopolysaccharide export system protein LptC
MLASAQDAGVRSRLYDGLTQRNRVVAILRIGLPALGVMVFAGLALQIVVASLLDEFGVSNIRIDRENLVVDTPSYSSMTPDGTMYAVASESAKAALGDTDLLRLTKAALTVTKPDSTWLKADAASAEMRLSAQTVFVREAMDIADSRGTSGTIYGVHANLVTEAMVSDGRAKIRYHNGTTLDAETMAYDGKARRWQFNRVTLVVPNTPKAKTPSPSTTLAAPE